MSLEGLIGGLIVFIIAAVVVGLLVWLVTAFLPLPENIKQLIQVAAIIILILILLLLLIGYIPPLHFAR